MRNVAVGAVAVVGIVAVAVTLRAASPAGTPTTSQTLASPASARLLTQIPINARLGTDGVLPSPNGELVMVVRRVEPPAQPTHAAIYDLAGREIAVSSSLPINGSAWLSDSSGLLLVTDRAGGPDALRFEARILGLDGSLRTVARNVRFPTERREVAVGPGGRLLFARCCPSELFSVTRDGSDETTVARDDNARVLGWDGSGRILYADISTNEVVIADLDGRLIARVSLQLPAGVRLVEVSSQQSGDRRATLIGFRADRAFEGGGQNGYGLRLFVDGVVRESFPGIRLDLPIGPHEVVASTPAGPVRYDLVSGVSSALHLEPVAISASLMYSPASVNPSPRVRMARLGDGAWRELDLPFDVMPWSAIPRPLAKGAFLIFDARGALWSLDGELALAQASAALPECRDTYPDPVEARKPIPAATAEEVRAGIVWDPAFRHMVEDIAGTRQDSNPLRDRAVPRCRVELLVVGPPTFVARATGGTWFVPVIYQGRTIVTALVATTDGKGAFAGSRGGPVPFMPEAQARLIGSLPQDPAARARLVSASPGRGPGDQIAWELTRSSGAIVYLFPDYPGAGADGRLFDARDVTLAP